MQCQLALKDCSRQTDIIPLLSPTATLRFLQQSGLLFTRSASYATIPTAMKSYPMRSSASESDLRSEAAL